MGKAEIITDHGDGLYTIELKHEKAIANALLASLEARLSWVNDRIDQDDVPEEEFAFLELKKINLLKMIERIEAAADMNFQTSAWCADLTEGLTGIVGTIEIGCEWEKGINIHPGYGSTSDYSEARDGLHFPFRVLPVANAILNFALMPGIQKWRPTFRYGIISNIDSEAHTCDVSISDMSSYIKGLDVNYSKALAGVTIEYMDCDSAAFEDGDEVIVKFDPRDVSGTPKVIGFKDNPKPCETGTYITIRTIRTGPAGEEDEKCYIIWDLIEDRYAQSPLFANDNWPKSWNEIADFMDGMEEEESNGDVYTLYRSRGEHEIDIPPDAPAFDCADPSAPNSGYSVNRIISQWATEGYREQIYHMEVCDDPVAECVYRHDVVCRTTEGYELIEAYNINADSEIRVWSGDFESSDDAPWPNSTFRTEWRKEKNSWTQCIDRGGWCQVKGEIEHDVTIKWWNPLGSFEINTEYDFWEYDYLNYPELYPLSTIRKNLVHMYQPFVSMHTDNIIVQIYPFIFDYDYKETERDPDNIGADQETTVEETGSDVSVLATYGVFDEGLDDVDPESMTPNTNFADAIKGLIESRIDDGQYRIDQYHLYTRIWKG
jgi:hypothetical protein